MVRAAFIFPGQGAQDIGMGAHLAERFASARDVASQVDEALGDKLFALMCNGPKETLDLTANAQPALLMVSMMALAALREDTGLGVEDAGFVAGHSCGEYVALTAAGSFDLGQAARLLRLRGEAMQDAVAAGCGGMAALLGADLGLAQRAAEHGQSLGVCEIANDNCPGQIVISGALPAVRLAMDAAKELGVRKAVLLPVSAPFHCTMMESARKVMTVALDQSDLKPPSVGVVSNDSARPQSEPDVLRRALVSQMTSKVRWRESMEWLSSQDGGGVTCCIEAGHGATLTALNRRICRRMTGVGLSDPSDIGSVAGVFGFR